MAVMAARVALRLEIGVGSAQNMHVPTNAPRRAMARPLAQLVEDYLDEEQCTSRY